MYKPVYLRLASNRVIDISVFDEIKWGKHKDKYLMICKVRDSQKWEQYNFSNAEYARRFAAHFYGGRCEEADNSIEKEIND